MFWKSFIKKLLMSWVLCRKLQNIVEGTKEAEEDAVQISIYDLLHYVERTVQLLGQSSNAITYHARLNVLRSVMNSQYQVKSMLKEKMSLMQNMTNIYSEKSSETILVTPSNPRDKQRDFHRTRYAFFIKPLTRIEKFEGQKFFLTTTGSKKFHNGNNNNNNNRNVIPTTDTQGVSNRDMVSIFAPLQTFFSMDINPERPIQQNTTFLDKSSSATFRNLHNKNSREKIKFKPLYKSGARATNLRLPEIFSFLTLFQHYVLEREIVSNYDEDQQRQFENEQNLVEDTIDIDSFCCWFKRIGIF